MYIWSTHLEIGDILSELENDNNDSKLTNSKIEGLNRLAIHAGYYACLNKIRQINSTKIITTKKGGKDSHNDIIESIRQYKDIQNKNKLIVDMKSLKDYRTKADYEDGNAFLYTNESTKEILKKCKKTFDILDKI